jgi:hypothetical protein
MFHCTMIAYNWQKLEMMTHSRELWWKQELTIHLFWKNMQNVFVLIGFFFSIALKYVNESYIQIINESCFFFNRLRECVKPVSLWYQTYNENIKWTCFINVLLSLQIFCNRLKSI